MSDRREGLTYDIDLGCEWVEWFVLEGPAPAAVLGLVVVLSIIAAFKYNRYLTHHRLNEVSYGFI